jgi:hypothetical protein
MLRIPDARKRMTNIMMAWTVIAVMFTLCNLMLQPSHGGVDEHASFMDETSFVSASATIHPHDYVTGVRPFTRRPNLPRAFWKHTTLYKIFERWPDEDFKKRLRVSRALADHIVQGLVDGNVFRDNVCQNPHYRYTARYKALVSLYYLAHGGSYIVVADSAGVSPSVLCTWVHRFAKGVIKVFAKQYIAHPKEDEMQLIMDEFERRRGIVGVSTAVNGTHVPWAPDNNEYREDYHNYKGWHSILVIAFVSSFYMFQGVEIGWPGRNCDTRVTSRCSYFKKIARNPEKYLGKDGFGLGDGAFAGDGQHIMSPYTAPKNAKQCFFNFCHSSTRFFVEQAFGIWKNRFRFLLKANNLKHKTATICIHATMVLHNMCMVWREDYLVVIDVRCL